MDYGQPNQVQQTLIDEVFARSGITIGVNPYLVELLVRELGEWYYATKASYMREQFAIDRFIPETILINTMWNDPELLHIMFHELAHATGLRVGRNMNTDLRAIRNIEETIAETTAWKLTQHYGLETADIRLATRDYLAQFSSDLTAEECPQCELEAEAAKDYILKNWLVTFNPKADICAA